MAPTATLKPCNPPLSDDANPVTLRVSQFPEHLRPSLQEIDDEGNGLLELDELTEMVTMYAAMKRASKEGAIAINTLPREIQPTLKVFDVDGDGTVAPLELARGAEMYKESKKKNKKLVRALMLTFLVVAVLIGVNTALSIVVVENAKEMKMSASGLLTPKGSDKPAAVGETRVPGPLDKSFTASREALDAVKAVYLTKEVPGATSPVEYSYVVQGWTRDGVAVRFRAFGGDTISVDAAGTVVVTDTAGAEIIRMTKSQARRRLNGFFSALQTSGSFTMAQAGSF